MRWTTDMSAVLPLCPECETKCFIFVQLVGVIAHQPVAHVKGSNLFLLHLEIRILYLVHFKYKIDSGMICHLLIIANVINIVGMFFFSCVTCHVDVNAKVYAICYCILL